MGSELRNPKKQPQLNPNWAQLCKKLKSHGTKPYSKATEKSESETPKSVLGKRKERSNAESGDSMPNPLVPTSSDCSYFFSLVRCFVGNRSTSVTDAIAMDCEMVGVSPLGNKSALGRVTLVNKCGNVIYDEYVRPVDRVVDFRTAISGIRPRDLRKAKEFRLVQKKVAELIKGRILVGHALRNDLRALLLSHSKKDLRDTSEYQPFLNREGRSKALRHLAAEFLGVKIQNGEHCPVEDARAAMLLYQKYKKEWEKSIKDFIRLKEKQKKRKQKKKPKEGEAVNLNQPKTVS
ncbi:unnamed protein product [Camellia sinensis]